MVRGKKHIHITSGTWSRKIFTKMHKKKPIKKNYKLDYIKSNNFMLSKAVLKACKYIGQSVKKLCSRDKSSNSQNTNI